MNPPGWIWVLSGIVLFLVLIYLLKVLGVLA